MKRGGTTCGEGKGVSLKEKPKVLRWGGFDFGHGDWHQTGFFHWHWPLLRTYCVSGQFLSSHSALQSLEPRIFSSRLAGAYRTQPQKTAAKPKARPNPAKAGAFESHEPSRRVAREETRVHLQVGACAGRAGGRLPTHFFHQAIYSY